MNFILAILIILLLFVGIIFLRKFFKLFLQKEDTKMRRHKEFLFQRLFPNLIIGLIVSCMIVFYPDYLPKFIGTALMEKEDSVIDLMIEWESFNLPPMEKDNPSFVLLDIDKTTSERWGKGQQLFFTPRDKLTHLIDAAVQAKAKLIVVDIKVVGRTPTEHESQLHPYDQKLHDYLKEHVKRCKEKEASCVPIILVRAFKDEPTHIREPDIGFLEDLVTPSAPYLQWGTAQFSYSDIGVWNRWRLLESTCSHEKPGVTPSIALLVMGMIQKCSQEEMQEALRPFVPNNCDSKEEFPKSTSLLSFCDLTTDPNDRIERRLMYRIPWSDTYNPPELTHKVYDDEGNEILRILEAYRYGESPPQASLEPLTNNIVVIGGSYDDVHDTPIGEMPGSLIIINAIYSLLQKQIIRPAPIWALLITISIFIVVITAVSFYVSFSSIWKEIGKVLLVIILLLVTAFLFSSYLFAKLIWFNVIVVLVIIEFLRLFEKYIISECPKWIARKTN